MTSDQTSEQKRLARLFEEIAPPRECQRYSVGHLCQFFECTPDQLHWLLDRAEVRFSYMVDTILYVDGNQLQQLVDKAKDLTAQAEAAPFN